MIRAILILMLDVVVFFALFIVGAIFQTAMKWPIGATATFFIPAFLYVWYRVPDSETNQRYPLGELLGLFGVVVAAMFTVYDLLQFPIESAASATIVVITVLLYLHWADPYFQTKASTSSSAIDRSAANSDLDQ